MIKLENIQKVFRTEEVETVALGGVSLEVKKGELSWVCSTIPPVASIGSTDRR